MLSVSVAKRRVNPPGPLVVFRPKPKLLKLTILAIFFKAVGGLLTSAPSNDPGLTVGSEPLRLLKKSCTVTSSIGSSMPSVCVLGVGGRESCECSRPKQDASSMLLKKLSRCWASLSSMDWGKSWPSKRPARLREMISVMKACC